MLSKESGLFFAGPDALSPRGEEAHLAMQFASPSKALRYATDLVRAQDELLQDDPIEMQICDPVSGKTTQAVSTADPYPVLRARWRRAFSEALPLDIPGIEKNPETARARLSDYLNATDWHVVRARGGNSFGFHPSF